MHSLVTFLGYAQGAYKIYNGVKYVTNLISIFSNDRYRVEDILMHEFSHGAHLLGTFYAIPGWDARLKSLYNSARARGLWAGTYAISTDHEYWVSDIGL